jgi:hypothetical protein
MKIQNAEILKKENLFNNNLYFIKYQNHKVALFREEELYILDKNEKLKKISYEQSNIFSWYTDYEKSSEIIDLMKSSDIESLYDKEKNNLLDIRPNYTAAFLEDEDKKKIIDNFSSYIEKDWNIVCHHMTMNLGRIKEKDLHLLNKEKQATVTHIGIDLEECIIALKLETDIPSMNEIKHITLCLKENTKAFKSNFIKNWEKVEDFKINLKVGEFLNNQTISYGQDKNNINKPKFKY